MAAMKYDVIIIGAGIAGLWLADRLKRNGYNLIVVDQGAIGGVQTLASQGMIHGGQKYAIDGKVSAHATSIADMPARWESCFGGWGEVDLAGVHPLSENQIMWPAGSIIADAAVFAAAQLVNANTRKLSPDEEPAVLAEMRAAKKFKGRVYELPEKVLDVKELVTAMSAPLRERIFKGTVDELMPDGQIVISGTAYRAQVVIFTAGLGNERALELMRVKEKLTQRRPLRQIMVKSMTYPLYGHGIVGKPKPRVTVTSHPLPGGGYVWYLGGSVAEEGATKSDDEAIRFARSEMEDMFPLINWAEKEWATWAGDRAEPFDEKGVLPPGPHVHQRGQVLLAWPTKLTFTPALADRVMAWMESKNIVPHEKSPLPDLPLADVGSYPWETAVWKTAS